MSTLRAQLSREYQILRALRNSDRHGIARVALAKTGGGVLSRVQQQLSGGNKILWSLWKAYSRLSTCELLFRVQAGPLNGNLQVRTGLPKTCNGTAPEAVGIMPSR